MVIAERHLKLQIDADIRVIAVRVFAPEPADGDWACRYEIAWPQGTRSFAMYGLDAVQALNLTLQAIGAEIYSSPYHTSGRLYWASPGDGYGFPLPSGLQGLAVGGDVHGS